MKYVWYKNYYLGYVQSGPHQDGSVKAWFPDAIGGPGYLLMLWAGEWKAAT
jgi:hypothetical protein